MTNDEIKELKEIRDLLDKARGELRLLDYRLFEEKGLFKKAFRKYELDRPREKLKELDKKIQFMYFDEKEKGEYYMRESGLF